MSLTTMPDGQVLPRSDVVTEGVGLVATATFTPAAAAYSAGDIIDVAKEFKWTDRNGAPVAPGSLIRVLTTVIKNDITAIPSGMTSFTGQCYSVTPPSAQADNAAWTMVSGDLPSYRGAVALGTPADLGSCLYVKNQYVDTDIKLADGKSSLFMELVTAGGYTAAATAIEVLLYGVIL